MNGENAAWGRALTLRRVNGELRFLALTVKHSVYEVTPQFSPTGPYSLADSPRFWGDVYRDGGGQGMRALDGTGRESGVYGLSWDQTDRRLSWSNGDGQNTRSADDPSVGWSMLDDASGRATALGVWRLPQVGCEASMGGAVPIPAWLSQSYCTGQRLGAGPGGSVSTATFGPVSAGPALYGLPSLTQQESEQRRVLHSTPGRVFFSCPLSS